MSVLDEQYINLVAHRLSHFVRKKRGVYNFRCPYCGDSKRHKNKARGYIFKMKNDFVFKCHNCGAGRTLFNFIKDQDPLLADQFRMERFGNNTTGKGYDTPNPDLKISAPVFKSKQIDLERISELNTEHPARKYLERRKIKCLDYFYYCPQFCNWTNKQKFTFDNIIKDEPRIIIPFNDENGKLFGYQGRSLEPNAKMRYITVMLNEDKPKIFGLDRIDTNEKIYIVEGPFDSTFIRNSVAMAGSDVDCRTYNWSDYIWVYDNEPRNEQIVSRITKSINNGEKVVIWPNEIKQKDINDMHLAGHDVQSVVQCNVYYGLEANLRINDWKKV